mmetsp:Transcript_35019/g.48561  ORF Transcript_35019/g.48561 Transcript_35019/m.48561 type:complete len:313 (-) Transcript_35019:588-1526(-)
MLINKVDEIGLAAISRIRDCLGFTSLFVVEGREALNGEHLAADVVGSRVHLCNDKLGVVLEVLGHLLPDGRQLLAVPAPGGVELNEDILVGIVNKLLEVLANHGHYGLVVGLGDLLGLDVYLHLASLEVVNPAGNSARLDVVVDVLEIGRSVVHNNRRQLLLGHAKELESSLVGGGVSLNKVHLTLIRLGYCTESLLHLLGALALVLRKEDGLGKRGGEELAQGVAVLWGLVQLCDDGKRLLVQPLHQRHSHHRTLICEFGIVVSLEEDNGRSRHTVEDGCIGGVGEHQVLPERLGCKGKGIELFGALQGRQ